MLKKFIILLIPFTIFSNIGNTGTYIKKTAVPEPNVREMHKRLGLEGKLDYDIFENAYRGYGSIDKKKNVLSVIDFTKPSTVERLFVIDMENEELLFSTHVTHGRNSGNLYANEFSNVHNSYKSSLGFYLTDAVYFGSNGYSLRLDGLEKGINDNARSRAIVIHGAKYLDPEAMLAGKRMGRSLGCPALLKEMTKPVIDSIKEGSVLFIYGNDENYLTSSPLLAAAM